MDSLPRWGWTTAPCIRPLMSGYALRPSLQCSSQACPPKQPGGCRPVQPRTPSSLTSLLNQWRAHRRHWLPAIPPGKQQEHQRQRSCTHRAALIRQGCARSRRGHCPQASPECPQASPISSHVPHRCLIVEVGPVLEVVLSVARKIVIACKHISEVNAFVIVQHMWVASVVRDDEVCGWLLSL